MAALYREQLPRCADCARGQGEREIQFVTRGDHVSGEGYNIRDHAIEARQRIGLYRQLDGAACIVRSEWRRDWGSTGKLLQKHWQSAHPHWLNGLNAESPETPEHFHENQGNHNGDRHLE